jgi:ubiquinone/menaquinone biosynthesis C-methylase UbiE
MGWFREGPSPFRTPLAMIGAKPGDRVLVLGAGDGDLAGEIGRVTGLNGRTLVVDADQPAAKRVEAGAAKAGALVEFEAAPIAMLPIDPSSFDLVVLNNQLAGASEGHRPLIFSESYRVLRDGGRVVTIETGSRPGLFGLIPRRALPTIEHSTVLTLLRTAGFRGQRLLAETEGVVYCEGRK